MKNAISAPALVVLKNGLSVPVDALRLLWNLEDRGLSIRLDAGSLAIGPSHRLTDVDRAGIRQHRDELVAIVSMCEAIQ